MGTVGRYLGPASGQPRDEPIADPQRRERARRFARLRRRLLLADLLAGAVVLVVFLVSGLAVRWQEVLEGWIAQILPALPPGPREALLLAAYVVSLTAAGVVLNLPLGYYGSFVLPHRFGLSVQTNRGWAMDALKGALLGVAQSLVVAYAVFALLRLSPDWWWLWAALVLTLFGVVLANLAPVLIVPLFYRLRPLADEGLRGRLAALAEGAGTRVRGVYVMDLSRRTRAANAVLMGWGNSRRILLGDTLLAGFTPDEVAAVLAHELGHHVHRDLWRGIVLEGGLTVAALWLADRIGRAVAPALGMEGLADVAALPLLLLVGSALFVLALPVTTGYSRRREAAADAFAVRVTGDAGAWKGALRRLADMNLAEVDPPPWVEWLLYTHPSIRHRLEAADRVAEATWR
jgi:Zn-dependent protease with chaperone function